MHTYLSRTHDSRLRTYTGRPRAPQAQPSRTHCDTTWGDLSGAGRARGPAPACGFSGRTSPSPTQRALDSLDYLHLAWLTRGGVCRDREGGRGLEYTYRDAAAGLRARRRGAGARGEGRGRGSSIHSTRDRARTQSSAPCSVFSVSCQCSPRPLPLGVSRSAHTPHRSRCLAHAPCTAKNTLFVK